MMNKPLHCIRSELPLNKKTLNHGDLFEIRLPINWINYTYKIVKKNMIDILKGCG